MLTKMMVNKSSGLNVSNNLHNTPALVDFFLSTITIKKPGPCVCFACCTDGLHNNRPKVQGKTTIMSDLIPREVDRS
jgi:hypothetical protein